MESAKLKRVNESSNGKDEIDRPKKKLMKYFYTIGKVYKFKILLPNGLSLDLKIADPPGDKMPVVVFADKVKEEYEIVRRTEAGKVRRNIDWGSPKLCFVDELDKKFADVIDFGSFEVNKLKTLRLNDGSKGDEVYENMWDLTPDVELLRELPQEYAFETALADLIDNSLQAVWSPSIRRSKLIRVEISKTKISIFDNGPGMDASEENSIVKWGRMGASLHRSSRGQAIGGKPPYLKPYFGMFGYGGPLSSMHLGRRTVVSSKTKDSKKVCTLYLQRDALLSSSGSDQTWKTSGGLRDPSVAETKLSPSGSFTKVEIFELKMNTLHESQLQCKLKDIYFPYIQCDDMGKTGRTSMPIEFQVNGIDLAEVEGGEVAITNLHSCNGPEFVLELHFTYIREPSSQKTPGNTSGQGAFPEANARLKCIYFPIVQGKENIERILEKLEVEGCGTGEIFESFSRVSIRCLGRLLPDARWASLPFMDPKQRKVDKAHILKRCCSRVKCFIETDGGFYPTPSKTDLLHHHHYTTALKNFGSKCIENEKDVHVEIFKDGKKLTLQQMEKQYQEWILQMHDTYDEESDCGGDEPVIVINPSNKKTIGISSDVVRVHKLIRRKGKSWQSGQKIKVLKGACTGVYKNNIYAVLEYILLEGFQGDAGGESRIICRQIGTSDEKGCLLSCNDDGNPTIDIRESMSLPISVIDSGKCQAIATSEWSLQLEKLQQRTPSSIDILCASHCEELDVEGSLPFDSNVDAGHVPPNEVIAVVRPASFNSAMVPKSLDQKDIAVTNSDMILAIKLNADDNNLEEYKHICSLRAPPSSRKGFRGLYIFRLKPKLIFEKAGEYKFSFHIKDSNYRSYVNSVRIKALSNVKRWGIVSDMPQLGVRVGSCVPSFPIACYDDYGNRTSFTRVPKVIAKVLAKQDVVLYLSEKMNVQLSSKKSALTVKNLMVESSELDCIRPNFEARLVICSVDESFDVSIPCKVFPGPVDHLNAKPKDFMKQLLPGNVVQELVLEVFDAYGNHVKQDTEMSLVVEGFHFQQKTNSLQVDNFGCVDLSGLLKVARGYGETVSISVFSNKRVVFEERSQTGERTIRVATEIPEKCIAGSQLENVVFEIVNSDGVLDETISDHEKSGVSHTLVLKSDSTDIDDSVRYSFCHGRCTVRAIPLPHKEGTFSFLAAHSRYSMLSMTIMVHLEQAPKSLYEGFQSQYTDGETLLLEHSSLKTPKVEHDNTHDLNADRALMVLPISAAPADHLGNLAGSLHNEGKELHEKVVQYASYIGQHEKRLETLQAQQLALEQDLSKMQVSLEPTSSADLNHLPEKEIMMERIKMKDKSAASVICKLKNETNNDFSEDILGVVTLFGSVQTNELGRILADFLGEEQMLAVVCKSYKSAFDFEKHVSGKASVCGTSLSGRYNVICLEDLRPYEKECSRDPQRRLLLTDPILPNRKVPRGFCGYAVNMIDVDVDHIHRRTAAGKGIRETLFYHLFGELQVYETMENMRKALPCIQHGAVSLDGGIITGNGDISFGCWDNSQPPIHFPVITPHIQNQSSPQNIRILKLMGVKKSKLRALVDEIDEEKETIEKFKEEFGKCKDKYSKFLDERAPIIQYLESASSQLNGTPSK